MFNHGIHGRHGIFALAFIAGVALSFCVKAAEPVRGAYPILTTPYLADGSVDYNSLVKEAEWTDAAGVQGIIWPQSDDSIDLLTMDEKKRGMFALAKAAKGFQACLCLGVQGRGTDEMLELARHGEKLAAETDPRIVFISRPADDCRTQKDLERYYDALAKVAKRPVIIQTYNGDKCPAPSVELLVKLATRHPAIYGWIKEKGIFKTTVSRVCVDKDKAPYAWKLDVLEVDGGVRAEIMRRCSVEGH